MISLRKPLPAGATPAVARALLALTVVAWAQLVQAQVSEQVVVTGSLAERAAAEAPYAIGSIDRDSLRSAGPPVRFRRPRRV